MYMSYAVLMTRDPQKQTADCTWDKSLAAASIHGAQRRTNTHSPSSCLKPGLQKALGEGCSREGPTILKKSVIHYTIHYYK